MPQLLFHKQDLAWLVNRKWALSALFGEAYAAQFAPLDEGPLQTAALALFHEAIQQGRFSHGWFIEERLDELLRARSFAEQVPYTPDFEATFAPEIARLDLLLVADCLYLLCLGYATEYPTSSPPWTATSTCSTYSCAPSTSNWSWPPRAWPAPRAGCETS